MTDPKLRVLAALLAQGRTVHQTTAVATLGVWLLSVTWLATGPVATGLVLAAGAVFAGESWYAGRVGVDAVLFQALADGTSLKELDRGLASLGLDRGSERPLAARVAGAVRLWRWQLGLAGLQGALLVLTFVLGVR